MSSDEPRRYTIRIEVEVSEQDDFRHFQPGTVVGRVPMLGLEWTSANDKEALEDFFRFFIRWSLATRPYTEGVAELARRALLAR